MTAKSGRASCSGIGGFGLTIVRFSPLYVRVGLIATKFGAAENCRDVPIAS
jgi:hypothetical protein